MSRSWQSAAGKRPFTRTQRCWHPDFRVTATRTVRNKFVLFKSHLTGVFWNNRWNRLRQASTLRPLQFRQMPILILSYQAPRHRLSSCRLCLVQLEYMHSPFLPVQAKALNSAGKSNMLGNNKNWWFGSVFYNVLKTGLGIPTSKGVNLRLSTIQRLYYLNTASLNTETVDNLQGVCSNINWHL